MASYVEVNDDGAAPTAAGRLSALGTQLDDHSLPEPVAWGDDEFGSTMIQQYTKDEIPALAMQEKTKLGRRLTEIGDATVGAVTEATTQELLNSAGFDGIHAPEV